MIIRRKRNRGYTIVGNHIPDDPRLDFDEIGMLTYLLSRPDNWNAQVDQLKSRGKCGRDKARSILKTLIDCGYVSRERQRSEDGKHIVGMVYTVYDEPLTVVGQGPENPSLEGQGPEYQGPEYQGPDNPSVESISIGTSTLQEPIERERARSEAEGTPTADAEPTSSDDPKKFEKRVKRLAQSLGWPGWAESSTDWTVARFAELTDAERADAERRGGAYLAHCGKRALSLGTYFRERKWVDLPAEAIAAADAPAMVAAPAFGAGQGMVLYEVLLRPPGPLSPPTASERAMIASGAFSEAAIMAEKRKKFGWPKANLLLSAMAHGQSLPMTAEREALAKRLMRGVEVGTPLWEEWREEHERRGWPWLPDPGGQKWVSFPAGGPDGLAAFEQAVREASDDGGGRQAA